MSIITAVVLLICGTVLCFFGYRSFRVAMSIAGFIIGAAIGMVVHGFVDQNLSSSLPGIVWLSIFMLIGGCVLGGISFRLYKAALYYVTMFTVSITVLRVFLLTTASGAGIYTILLSLFGVSKNETLFASLDNTGNPDQWMSGVAKEVLAIIPGRNILDKFWLVLIVSLLIGAIAGVIVCALQKPAIIVVTAVFGGLLVSQAICMLIGIDWASAESIVRMSSDVAGGVVSPEISAIITLAAILAGMITQTKMVKKEPVKKGRRTEDS